MNKEYITLRFIDICMYGLCILATLIAMFLTTGCGNNEDTHTETTFNCSVEQDFEGNGVITCPDGSTVTVEPQVITNTIVSTPVVIRVPRNCRRH
jgi:hypothetical protein